MDYLIRRCREDDLPAFVVLCEMHVAYEDAPYQAAGKQASLRLALFADNPKLFCLVVECKQRVIGYASYTFDFSTWHASHFLHLDCLYLEPAHRSRGIGEKIIDMLKEIATQHGCTELQWQTPLSNERAIKFYKRVGATGRENLIFSLPGAPTLL